MTSSIVIRSPPITSRESRMGAPKRGTLSHGAAVLAAWYSSVGTQGRYRMPAPTKARAASRMRPRRSSELISAGSRATSVPAKKNVPQVWV